MPEKVFISYRHTDGPWVWGRLKPVLEAGGLEVLIDIERFRAGVELFQQMDDLQDQADCQLLVVSEPYLKSPSCKHEMHRAIESDPDFQSGKVILVRIDDAKWPRKLTQPNPLYAFMKDDSQPNAWDALLRGLEIDLGVSPAEWLRARDEIVQLMERGLSVNLVCEPDAAWRALLQHLQTAEHPQTLLPDLRIVDLESAKTASRRGLLQQIVKHCGYAGSLPQPPEDLVAFGGFVEELPFLRLALEHFDMAAPNLRGEIYGVDFFAALRHLMMNERKLALVAHSRQPFAAILPQDHPLSHIDIKAVKLRKRV